MESTLTERNFVQIIEGLRMIASSITKGRALISTFEERNAVTSFIRVSVNELSHVICYQIFKNNDCSKTPTNKELDSLGSPAIKSHSLTNVDKEDVQTAINNTNREFETMQKQTYINSTTEFPHSSVINKKPTGKIKDVRIEGTSISKDQVAVETESEMVNQNSSSTIGILNSLFDVHPDGKVQGHVPKKKSLKTFGTSPKIYQKPRKLKNKKNSHNDTAEKVIHSCSHCEETFIKREDLEIHLKIHMNERPYSCKYCKETFSKLKRLECHEIKEHGEKAHSFMCNSKASSKDVKQNYVKIVNVVDKRYKCSYCQKSFHCFSQKKKHELIHSGEKPFKCSYCDQAFTLLSTKTNHERLHPGERPYKCSYCDKVFTQSCNKVTHEKLHTGERP